MTNSSIKDKLMDHGLRVWQLCNQLGISRTTYYEYCHKNFKGKKTIIRKAIRDLIKGDKQHADK